MSNVLKDRAKILEEMKVVLPDLFLGWDVEQDENIQGDTETQFVFDEGRIDIFGVGTEGSEDFWQVTQWKMSTYSYDEPQGWEEVNGGEVKTFREALKLAISLHMADTVDFVFEQVLGDGA